MLPSRALRPAQEAPLAPARPLIVGRSAALLAICELAERVAAGDAKVLITGESGVGKDLVARLIHFHSSRAAQPYIAVNCAGVPETLLESQIFGHVKGAFTDAYRDKAGILQQAHNGTVFLDEVAEMSLRMQAMLLRFLENGEIQPVGSDLVKTQVDVRVIAATNKDLATAVAAGHFREDLMYRLDVVHIRVPALRERPEDIRALVEHQLARAERRITLTDEAIRALERYRWPGNVRELQNVIERLIWMSATDTVGIEDLPVRLLPGRTERVFPARERRRQRADELFKALTDGSFSFWDHIHPLFLDRDLTRHDLRELVRRGLAATRGNYRAVVRLFGMPDADYKRFLNFLGTHGCVVDFREFRTPAAADGAVVKDRVAREAGPPKGGGAAHPTGSGL
ncbi:MAG TPA: sigma-54 dependent transcriptional regulator [Vicinamibacterales bacterium]|nr:sigma-54 dependent transcriptional regulator [Vicinamibacterales bacterium]HOQ59530.1 sigma-54 dependent transcriptional regulator [Vicinamibacterales bacterium]